MRQHFAKIQSCCSDLQSQFYTEVKEHEVINHMND